jgi:hypothetical protein
LKFPSQDIRKLDTFENLPSMLRDARRLGCDCLYLVDYWEGGYELKGDYIPRSDLGGPESFRKGVAAVHQRGGKVLLYLEAFIIHRQSKIGRQHGLEWAMLDSQGQPYSYYGRTRFFLMYPGPGSGWTDYLCGLVEHLTRAYGVDGFHLDSYGLQWNWKDHHPKHPNATDPSQFNRAAVQLVRTMRERIRFARVASLRKTSPHNGTISPQSDPGNPVITNPNSEFGISLRCFSHCHLGPQQVVHGDETH